MADIVFNIAKGRWGYYTTLPAANDALLAVLLKSSGLEADATLADYDTLAAVLAASNDEADFTNYSRKTLSSVTSAPDDTNNWLASDADDLQWLTAGGATNNTLGKLLVVYDPDTTTGSDSDLIPLFGFDISVVTDGTTLNVTINASGLARAS